MNTSYCSFEILTCIAISCAYVGSLYLWQGTESRDHTVTIRKRSISVIGTSLLLPFIVQCFLPPESLLLDAVGVRSPGIVAAIFLPYLLTCILFLGPLVQNNMHIPLKAAWSLYLQPGYWVSNFTNAIWWRNQIVAPFSEELTFRACMLPILLQCMSPTKAVVLAPLFFGIAHIHHAIERSRNGIPAPTVFLITTLQFAYTTVFGLYCAFIFMRTGHFISLYVVHAFCNHMGLPEFQQIFMNAPADRNKIVAAYVTGLISWYFLLYPLTEPHIFSNNTYEI